MREINMNELAAVTGGAEAVYCLYEDKKYSQGATVSQGGGVSKTCDNGTWR